MAQPLDALGSQAVPASTENGQYRLAVAIDGIRSARHDCRGIVFGWPEEERGDLAEPGFARGRRSDEAPEGVPAPPHLFAAQRRIDEACRVDVLEARPGAVREVADKQVR